ncbi:hypothetical protein HDV63DRAFT_367779 [Trichoderma sp. SZMC 28014]
MPDFWANDNTEYDDEDVYKDHCPDLRVLPASVPMINGIDLYINRNHPAVLAQGSTKSHYTPVPGGTVLFDTDDKSDYQFSVERLAWVDGWQESTMVDGKRLGKQPMTLVVLKFVLQTFDKDLRVETIKATLQFKDANQERGDDPEVQAWAPFHDSEDWNATGAQIKTTRNMNATASGGYDGASLSLGWDKGREITWDQAAFDEGRSILVKSKRKQRPIGVTWSLKQNKLQQQGVPPVILTAVLIKRTSDSPYLVKFRMDLRTGTRRDMKSKSLQFLRIKPGDTSSFTATPNPGVWDEKNCFGEGENIRDSGTVDLYNLGKLLGKDRTALAGPWGPQNKRSAPSTKEAEDPAHHAPASQQRSSEPTVEAELGPPRPEATLTEANVHTGRHVPARSSLRVPAYVTAGISDVSDAPRLQADTDPCLCGNRLVALESRAAQTETRLAAQDLLILQLQRAVDARDVQLTKMEQALRGIATSLSQL